MGNRSFPGMAGVPGKVSANEKFREKMLDMVPEAVCGIRELLNSVSTPPAVKVKVIEMVLKYGLGDETGGQIP